MTEDQRVLGWFLPRDKLNQKQAESIKGLIEIAKHAHYVNVLVRINGRDEWYEIDWLKHMVKST